MSHGHELHNDHERLPEEIRAVLEDCLRRRAAGDVVRLDVIADQHARLMPQLGPELEKLRVIWMAKERMAGSLSDTASIPGSGEGYSIHESSPEDDSRASE